MTTFDELGLIEPLRRSVAAEGYTTPTPVQQRAIPAAIAGRDLLGVAQTGTGKTAAFTLPLLQRLHEAGRPLRPLSARALVLTPTRELAIQIGDSVATYGRFVKHRHAVVYGGVGQQPQVSRMRGGVDTLVATPGRLLDLMNQGRIRLDHVEIFVLDEADRMLDMGFIHDVKRIVSKLPKKRQTLFFSATMPAEITGLANEILSDYERIEVQPTATTADRVLQRVLFVEKGNKRSLLGELFADPELDRTIVFTRTKHGADRVARYLRDQGIDSDSIHGNKSQSARQRALEAFRNGSVRVLVATDIAARGIDVDDVSHVINFDLPNEPDNYVHRIGRTARAGAEGVALSFCDAGEVAFLRAIERTIRQKVEVHGTHGFHDSAIEESHGRPERGRAANGRGRPTGRSRNGSSRNGSSRNGYSRNGYSRGGSSRSGSAASGPGRRGDGNRGSSGKARRTR